MNSDLIVPTVLLVIVVAAAFVIGRVRAGGWDPRRDGIVLVAVAVMGGIAVLLVVAPRSSAVVVISILLVLAGLYLLTRAANAEGPPSRRLSIQVVGAGAIVVGILGAFTALIRPPF